MIKQSKIILTICTAFLFTEGLPMVKAESSDIKAQEASMAKSWNDFTKAMEGKRVKETPGIISAPSPQFDPKAADAEAEQYAQDAVNRLAAKKAAELDQRAKAAADKVHKMAESVAQDESCPSKSDFVMVEKEADNVTAELKKAPGGDGYHFGDYTKAALNFMKKTCVKK